MLRDFMGTPYRAGDYVAAGGSGNGAAEYGMILYRVEAIEPKLKLIRLTSHYPTSSSNKTEIKARKVTATNTNKYVVVQPPPYIIDLFDRGVEGKLTQAEANLLGRWIHGAEHQVGLFP